MKIKTLENIMAISMIAGLVILIGATMLDMKKTALGTMTASTTSALASLSAIGYKVKKGNLLYEDEQALNGVYE